jgi:uncharacterized membrane protein YcjF (UPF0283 family)
MNPLIRRLAREVTAPLEEMLARSVKKLAFVVIGVTFLIGASVFLTIDLFLFTQILAGTLAAALCVAGFFLIAGIICLWLAVRPRRQSESEKATASPISAAAASENSHDTPSMPPNPEFAAKIDAIVAPILELLREADLQKEVLAVEAGTAIAKQLNPFSLIGFAIVAGVIIGRIARGKRTLL